MTLAQDAPDFKKLQKHALQKMDLADVKQMICDFSNINYLNWQSLQLQNLPSHLTPQLAWAIIKLHRHFNKQLLPSFTKKNSNFHYNLTGTVNEKLHQFDRKLSHKLCLLKTETKQHLLHWQVKEAINCCQLAGYNFSENEGRRFLLSGRKARKDWQVVLGKINQQLKNEENKNLSWSGFKHLCENFCLMKTAQPLRQTDGLNCCDAVYGTHYYEAIVEADELENGIKNLLKWLKSDDEHDFTHPLIKAIYCHFWLLKSAPIYQHNGIIARLTSSFYLHQKDYRGLQYLSLCKVTNKHFSKYSSSFFNSINDDGDLTYFILFILNCLDEAIENWELFINKKQEEAREFTNFIEHKNCNKRQLSILKMVGENPDCILYIKDIENTFGVAYETARTDLLGLVEMKLLLHKLMGKKWVFWKKH